ncbi:MAG TPA: DUF427 domain-containing protein [Acidimicrobiales bacterium]|nr:DUF427 domain-containing protein [Acidimicrobiales bacterium]
MNDYPQTIVPVNHVEPVPRRVRARLGDRFVVDTTSAIYVWEWSHYPQYYLPLADIDADILVDEQHEEPRGRGTAKRYGIRAGDLDRPGVAHLYIESDIDGIAGRVRFDWSAFDSWFEEDEEVFVHPRDPYSRVDALRSTRTVTVGLDGIELARSSSPVMVFETGLPTRYYFNRTEVEFEHLVPSDTVTSCPYKGQTTDYWSVRLGDQTFPDLAWAYDFPTRQLLPIAGLVAFYNEKVDIEIDGERRERPDTHFS